MAPTLNRVMVRDVEERTARYRRTSSVENRCGEARARPPLGAPTPSRMAPARDEPEPLTGQSPGPEWVTRLQTWNQHRSRPSTPVHSSTVNRGLRPRQTDSSEHRGALVTYVGRFEDALCITKNGEAFDRSSAPSPRSGQTVATPLDQDETTTDSQRQEDGARGFRNCGEVDILNRDDGPGVRQDGSAAIAAA
jgi:hypothetical protein